MTTLRMFAARIEGDTIDALRRRAAAEGRPVSELVREALVAAVSDQPEEGRRAS